MEIKKIDVECVDVFWDKVEHWIESATKQSKGRHTLVSTRKLLLSGNMEMFLVLVNKAICAVYVVQKTFYPAKSVLSILFCGGSKVIKNIKKMGFIFLINPTSLFFIYSLYWECSTCRLYCEV